ncbi:MAG: hypothetical protein HQK53_08180, partial [Oligoflexia bacterium]|nr:hypothetical protein [Oligoflexia bacterium]
IFLSAYGDDDDVIHALSNGAYSFIKKPIDRHIFVLNVSKALEYAQHKRLLYCAAKELVTIFCKVNTGEFEKLNINEQNKLLDAALGILRKKGVEKDAV